MWNTHNAQNTGNGFMVWSLSAVLLIVNTSLLVTVRARTVGSLDERPA